MGFREEGREESGRGLVDDSCNIPDFRLLGDSHITILHTVRFHTTSLLVRILHQSESFVCSSFQDIDNMI